ncbi:MAG TPA: hydrogenase maturation nickel metallochaperone HypA [bacterium]|nr:hydrogenase maturation nickel metallochaperone HypA [bacterium]
MHELGIAAEIQKIVTEALEKNAITTRVILIRLDIGEMRQLVPDALEFCFAGITKGSQLEGAQFEITTISLSGTCEGCGTAAVVNEPPFICPECGSRKLKIEKGFELAVKSFEVADD